MPARKRNGKPGWNPPVTWSADVSVCGMVATESITVWGTAPGVTVADGEKEAVAPAGSVDTPNVTGSEKVPCEDETVRANIAVCPAVTGGVELGGETE